MFYLKFLKQKKKKKKKNYQAFVIKCFNWKEF